MSGTQTGRTDQPPPASRPEPLGTGDARGPGGPPPGSVPHGLGRHAASVVLGLLLTPVALALFEYVAYVGRQHAARLDVEVDASALLAAVVAAVLLFVVAVLGRVSPLGPLVSGLVWGVLPWVMVTFFLRQYLSLVGHLPEVCCQQVVGVGESFSGGLAFVYAVLGALLIGTGAAAAWPRRGSRR